MERGFFKGKEFPKSEGEEFKNEFPSGKPGTDAKPDVSVDQVTAADFDGVVIPGGYAPDLMRRSPQLVQFVKDLFDAGKTVSAICHAGWMLASAGVLKGKNITSFFAIKDDMVNAGAEWVDQEVVMDGNLITSRKYEYIFKVPKLKADR